MMRDLYAAEHLPFDERVATRGLRELLADPSLGTVYIIEVEGGVCGYVVVAVNFSLEFHGRYAWIDELYVRAPSRGCGIGSAVLRLIEAEARDRGFDAVRLEVTRGNAGAARLYRRVGYEDLDRDLLTRWIR